MKGYVQVYTGNGKGKTTAAIGLAIRAAGAGMKVLFAQFVKGRKYSEIRALERFDELITLRQYGRECFIANRPTGEDIEAARAGLEAVREDMKSGTYQLVILDEACIAVYYGLFSADELLMAIRERNPECEVVATGRYAPTKLVEAADLVTEMKEVKHYYARGVAGRCGVES
ncbi:MAG: cob(I)yrinic acid a,c-diamide adenosyltransferase [Chitinivibrionales bacterium]|nr:cob(I)yrinic acid a,c-diamide adenosyltransferase [Chitinivibrionales bacterium]MBD3395542.1 cob(I)yrinic acid a,c-diamide adenosyltransferase [Chitinivibrionales bacterium]